jgi:hypothetical protein
MSTLPQRSGGLFRLADCGRTVKSSLIDEIILKMSNKRIQSTAYTLRAPAVTDARRYAHKFMKNVYIIIVCLIIALPSVIYSAQAKQKQIQNGKNEMVQESVSWISTTKDVTNILFFLAAGTVAVLSYLQAKKTIFTPIKTEIFKLQLKAFEDVLVCFDTHSSNSLSDKLDYQKIMAINSFRMLDQYASLFFEEELDKDKVRKLREPIRSDIAGAFVSQEHIEKFFVKPDAVQSDVKNSGSQKPTSPAIILAEWNDYDHGMIEFTRSYEETMERIRSFSSSPLLPSELKELIRKFEEDAHYNLEQIAITLNETAKELPKHFKNVETLKKCDIAWIWNTYNKQKRNLSIPQQNILNYLNSYLKIDSVLPREA